MNSSTVGIRSGMEFSQALVLKPSGAGIWPELERGTFGAVRLSSELGSSSNPSALGF
jgi:hypothetical protein